METAETALLAMDTSDRLALMIELIGDVDAELLSAKGRARYEQLTSLVAIGEHRLVLGKIRPESGVGAEGFEFGQMDDLFDDD